MVKILIYNPTLAPTQIGIGQTLGKLFAVPISLIQHLSIVVDVLIGVEPTPPQAEVRVLSLNTVDHLGKDELVVHREDRERLVLQTPFDCNS